MQTLVVTITNINDKTLEEANLALKIIDKVFNIGENHFTGEISIDSKVVGNSVSKELLTNIFGAFTIQLTIKQGKV
jgi:hypothetical protein